jgi:hypothetical protein
MEVSSKKNIITLWFVWQFYEMPKFLLGIWKNYILFASNYFSLPVLLKSLFSPWRKYRWDYPKGINVTGFLNTLISNSFSRFMGALMRILLIVCGILFQIFVLAVGLLVFLFWILVPFIIIAGFLFLYGFQF